MPRGESDDARAGPWSAYRLAVRHRALRPAVATDEHAAVRAAWRRKWTWAALGSVWFPVVLLVDVVAGQIPPAIPAERLYPDPAGASASGASVPIALLGLLAAAATAGAFVLPDLLDDHHWRRVQHRVRLELPGYLDLLGLCTRAGLTLEAAIERVSSASEAADPLAVQWRRVLSDIRLGATRRRALDQMAWRVGLADLDGVVAALAQSEGLGMPVTATLHNQSQRLRERQRFRAEEAAQKVQVTILFPLICCLLPALLLVVIGPAAVRILDVVQSS